VFSFAGVLRSERVDGQRVRYLNGQNHISAALK